MTPPTAISSQRQALRYATLVAITPIWRACNFVSFNRFAPLREGLAGAYADRGLIQSVRERYQSASDNYEKGWEVAPTAERRREMGACWARTVRDEAWQDFKDIYIADARARLRGTRLNHEAYMQQMADVAHLLATASDLFKREGWRSEAKRALFQATEVLEQGLEEMRALAGTSEGYDYLRLALCICQGRQAMDLIEEAKESYREMGGKAKLERVEAEGTPLVKNQYARSLSQMAALLQEAAEHYERCGRTMKMERVLAQAKRLLLQGHEVLRTCPSKECVRNELYAQKKTVEAKLVELREINRPKYADEYNMSMAGWQ